MNTTLHRTSARSARRCVTAACVLLFPLLGGGCGDEASSEIVSAQYSPDSEFTLTHPSGAKVAIPPGARATGLTIVASVPPPTRRPGGAAIVGVALTLTPTNPGITSPATVTLPITPSMIPAGGNVIILQSGPNGVYVPAPTRRVGNAVVAETFTFGDFFPVVMLPADGGVPRTDLGITDAGVTDAGATDAGSADVSVEGDAAVEDTSVAVDAGPYCGDGIWQNATEQCDNGENNHMTCNFAGDCTLDCLYCIE